MDSPITDPSALRYHEPQPAAPEIALLGGDVTEGLVRVGDTVRRPSGPASRLIREALLYLERVGFTGAPRFLGVDDLHRDVLSFVPGEVAGRPWPAWVQDPVRVASVARLVRAYDDAIAPFGLPEHLFSPAVLESTDERRVRQDALVGMPALIELERPFLGHRDITPENTVFVDGRASALIDFDLLQPSSRVEEVCNLLLWWAPLMPAADREPVLAGADPFQRARLIVSTYGLTAPERALVVPVAVNQAARSWFSMRYRADTLGGGWRRMWDDGIGDRIQRRQAWLAEHGRRLADAVS